MTAVNMINSKVHVVSNRSVVQYKFIGGGWFPPLLCITILGAIFLPYFVVLLTGSINPVLPFVSQAAGSPPQSGVFSIFLCFTVILCFIGLHILHMAIRLYSERLEIKNSRQVVDLLNKAILIPGHIGILGILIVAAYPLDFHRHNEDWMVVTLIPHLTGAFSLFIGGICFCILFTYIMSVIQPEQSELRSTRLGIIAVIILCAALHAATVNSAFMKEYYDPSRLRSCVTEPREYDYLYITCSVCEWLMLVAFVCFFYTLKHEGQLVSFSMAVTMDNDLSPPEKVSKPVPAISSNVEEKKKNNLNSKKESQAQEKK